MYSIPTFAPPSFSDSGSSASLSWNTASGSLAIPMTNDYLFRALLQSNNYVLKGLISSLLHLPLADIHSVTITNPIELGKAIDDKTFFLDIKIALNSHTIINLEMQVINEHNWPDRSLSYLCRSFDQLKSGDFYWELKPVIQISLLDFTLFPDHPEFYATYQFLNVKKYTLYSDKLRLSVLDLTHIELATEEDKRFQLDYWASLFKSTTWEELKMLAQKNEFIKEASATVYQLTQEETIRLQCEAREDYYRRHNGMQRMLEEQALALQQNAAIIENQNTTIKKLSAENDALRAQLAALEKQ